MIYLDTERLQQMVGTLESANQRIDEATNILMQITTHDDWGCAERHQINDYILQNKNVIQQLQSTSGGFYNIMKQVAAEFVETEENIGSLFESLEGAIAGALSVAVNCVSGVITAETIANTVDHLADALGIITMPFPIIPAIWSPAQVILGNQEWTAGNMQDVLGNIIEEPYHTGQNHPDTITHLWETAWAKQQEEQGIYVFGLKDFEI